MKIKIVGEIICGLLISLYVYVAVSKLLDYGLFTFQLQRSPYIFPYAPILSSLLPLSELLVAGLLMMPKTRFIGLYASLLLMSLFTCYVYLLLNYSDHIPCSCGGVISLMSWKQHFIFNCIVTTLNLIAIGIEPVRAKPAKWLAGTPKIFSQKPGIAEHP